MRTVALAAEIATLGLSVLFASLVRQFHQDPWVAAPAPLWIMLGLKLVI